MSASKTEVMAFHGQEETAHHFATFCLFESIYQVLLSFKKQGLPKGIVGEERDPFLTHHKGYGQHPIIKNESTQGKHSKFI
jgi:hypothetical protein